MASWALAVAALLARGLPAGAFPVQVRGADEASFDPKPSGPPVVEAPTYDAVVVGGGLAGLSASVYLSDRGKSVLVLEKEPELGGLAFGGTLPSGVAFNRGAAYWTGAYDEELKILERIGLGGYKELHAIPEPIDSYLWGTTLYVGLWEPHTLERLPASFELFKHELKLANAAGLFPNQPIEESGRLELDRLTAAEWIRGLPAETAKREDEASKAVRRRFAEDSRLDRADPMGDVVRFMDLFCRSALGTTPDRLSALAFGNFYISEIETRYTTPHGTGEAVQLMERVLRNRRNLVTVRTRSTVRRVSSAGEGLEVAWVEKGADRRARARYAVFAAQLKFAPRLLPGLAEAQPDKVREIEGLPYANFSIHVVRVKGHPYRASFDTWTRPDGYQPEDFTDVILSRWMDPGIKAYEGARDFKKDPPDDDGVLAVYHPLDLGRVGKGYGKAEAEALARSAVTRFVRVFDPLLKEKWGTRLVVRSVETNRWPYSIHVAAPGHFTRAARALRRPFGRVFFANNNIGTPAFEEALFRGHCAANNILSRMDPEFKQEPWTRCPLEK